MKMAKRERQKDRNHFSDVPVTERSNEQKTKRRKLNFNQISTKGTAKHTCKPSTAREGESQDTSPKKTTYKHLTPEIIMEETFRPLDITNPEESRRLHQRRRVIQFGKNTVGYDNYIKQVPKHKRIPRTLQHPSTPDHTKDIPNRRWLGLVKAWRKALHEYDPPEMREEFNKMKNEQIKAQEESKEQDTKNVNNEQQNQKPTAAVAGIKEAQINFASAQGLMVDFDLEYCNQVQKEENDLVDECKLKHSNRYNDSNGAEDEMDEDDVMIDYDDSDDDLL